MDNAAELKRELGKLIHEIVHKSREVIETGEFSNLTSLCEQDITILSCISENQYITAKEISEYLEVPRTTAVSAAARLESRGYIIKIPNEKDKRERLLELTSKGVRANKEHLKYEDIFAESLSDMWDEPDRDKLAVLLKSRRKLI